MPVGRSGSSPSLTSSARRSMDDCGVEVRPEDHARDAMHPILAVAQGARLGGRLGRAADEMLRLPRLDPEVRRIIREIGEHGHVGDARPGAHDSFVHRPIEVRNERDHEVRPGLAPMPPQPARHGAVAQADQAPAGASTPGRDRRSSPARGGCCRCPPNPCPVVFLNTSLGSRMLMRLMRRTCQGRSCCRITASSAVAAARWPPPALK